MAGAEEREWFHAEERAAWRAWLAANHGTSPGVWLVTWQKASGRPILSYDDAVSEALAFGWVDTKGMKVDDERTRLLFTPRKRGSGWSRPNKERIQRLEADGLMTPAGTAVIEAAKADGSWTLLDDVEDLVVPDDLAAAFERHAGSHAQWDGFPRSARRAMLEWIVQAKRAETRATRVEQTALCAARGERAR
jgi:uncharacterized protein YdeI (YjbR/CyaY-like superfamily)